MTQWGRKNRKYKCFILGGRAGSTLVHKNLLITGLLNWGWWSLEYFESEAQVKTQIWRSYPNVRDKLLQPKYFWNIAKAPEFGMVIDQLIKLYPDCKIIYLKRPLEDRLNSLVNTWGEGLKTLWKGIPNWYNFLRDEALLDEDPSLRDLLYTYLYIRDKKEKEVLDEYNQENILRIQFNDLMNHYEIEMKKIADFLDINFNVYQGLWTEMRKIKHMETSSNISKWI